VNKLILRVLKNRHVHELEEFCPSLPLRQKCQRMSGFRFQSREHVYGAVTILRAPVPLNCLSGGCHHMARGTLKSLYARLLVHAQNDVTVSSGGLRYSPATTASFPEKSGSLLTRRLLFFRRHIPSALKPRLALSSDMFKAFDEVFPSLVDCP
jgi:hypothetical protein